MDLTEASKELIQLNALFKQINVNNNIKILFCNNKLAIDVSKNSEHCARTKHINIQYHFIRDCINQDLFKLIYINTKQQLADALTKPVNNNAFKQFINFVNIKNYNNN